MLIKLLKKIPKESNQEAIQGTFQFEEETASTEQTENPNEDNSQDYNYNNDNLMMDLICLVVLMMMWCQIWLN